MVRLDPKFGIMFQVFISFCERADRNKRFRRLHYFTGGPVIPPRGTFARVPFPTPRYLRGSPLIILSRHGQPGKVGHDGPAMARPLSCPSCRPSPANLSPTTGERASCRSGHVRDALTSDDGQSSGPSLGCTVRNQRTETKLLRLLARHSDGPLRLLLIDELDVGETPASSPSVAPMLRLIVALRAKSGVIFGGVSLAAASEIPRVQPPTRMPACR
jgi:hypothetical protein